MEQLGSATNMPSSGLEAMRGVAPRAYLVGGGIASLAAAAFMIRDGGMAGSDIIVLEELAVVGGSLDAAGSAERGYVFRGGRMLESKYRCTFGLFASIPTLDGKRSVTDETFEWNKTMPTWSNSRLFRNGQRQTAPAFGLSERHILTIERLVLEPERVLGAARIEDEFDDSFFKTDFWFMWCSTFAFQPWHSAVEFKRYLRRFAHMVDGFDRLHGIMRTVYNQYDSLVRPLQKWLVGQGVRFEADIRVTGFGTGERDGKKVVEQIEFEQGGVAGHLVVEPGDRVLVTLGSMTDSSSLGTMDEAPSLSWRHDGSAFALWRSLAQDRPEFGHPWIFANHVDQSKWVSFTATLHDPTLLRLVQDRTGNVPGEGGLITFPDSGWLLSVVIPHQPHFIGQPDGVSVLWGYGLAVDAPGTFVRKPMSSCSGREIMTELLGHLRIAAEAETILAHCICVPCMMPYITSQFLQRSYGDRPQVIPAGWSNLAFAGQFCELPEDVVFTVEYSIRSAQVAAYGLLDLQMAPPPVYQGAFDPRVLYHAFRALHDLDVDRTAAGSHA